MKWFSGRGWAPRVFQLGLGVGVLIAAGLQAQTAGAFGEMALLPEAATLAAAGPLPTPVRNSSATKPLADATSILRRHVFDHETELIDQPETTDPSDATPERGCTGVKVIGLAAGKSGSSLALFRVGQGQAVLREVGGSEGGYEVLAVEPERLVLAHGGKPCEALLYARDPVSSGPAPASSGAIPRPATSAQPRVGLPPAIAAGIAQTGANDFNIDRGTFEYLLENAMGLQRPSRSMPEQDASGKVVGFRMTNIPADHALAKIGLKNGDLLRTVNGFDITQPESALQAYARIRQADRVDVDLTREGKPAGLHYTIK